MTCFAMNEIVRASITHSRPVLNWKPCSKKGEVFYLSIHEEFEEPLGEQVFWVISLEGMCVHLVTTTVDVYFQIYQVHHVTLKTKTFQLDRSQ